jgi:hypothetical protein
MQFLSVQKGAMHGVGVLNSEELCEVSDCIVDRFSFCLTLVNLLNAISAWLRDMTGLSNQALSAAPNKPLSTLFEALPILIEDLLGFKLMTRSAGLMSAFKARRVMLTKSLSV